MTKFSLIKTPLACIAVILLLSYGFTALAVFDDYWFKRFNYVMFIPAPLAALFLFLQTKSFKELLRPLFTKLNLQSILFSLVYPLVIIFSCALIAQTLGWAKVNWSDLNQIKVASLYQLLWAIGFLLGEEYAWRGYLLPALASKIGYIKAATIVGFVWAIWHGPLVYLLASRLGTWDSPMVLALVQMFVVFIFSFPFAYSYQLSRSVIPPMLLHYVWNWINPEVLGNIYRNQPGIAQGDIFLINGEGVLGAFLGLFFTAWYLFKFRKSSSRIES